MFLCLEYTGEDQGIAVASSCSCYGSFNYREIIYKLFSLSSCNGKSIGVESVFLKKLFLKEGIHSYKVTFVRKFFHCSQFFAKCSTVSR